ncbi:MAG: Flp pilus assembly complex ATPase component TadA [candidate division WS1 bacterium]|jgi:type IV pilus assembly protein PilB|nr:Flp pilus assembly complex ATPase component TadA [candidate division WS1 bacterium]
MAAERDEMLAQNLVEMGLLTPEQLDEARQYAEQERSTLVQALLRLEMTTAGDLARAAEHAPAAPAASTAPVPAEERNVAAASQRPAARRARPDGKASLDSYEVDPEALRQVPKPVAEEHLALPLQVSEDRILVAMADPGNVFAIDVIRARTGKRVEPIEVDEVELRNAIEQYYATRAQMEVSTAGAATTSLEMSIKGADFATDMDQKLVEMLDQAPVVAIVEQIMKEAVRMRASDIHIEPRADQVRVRYRVDGQLMTFTTLPSDMHRYAISRLKIMAGADISETRMPQDGRFATEVDDRPIDVRFSTLPTYWGEKAVLRLLDKSRALVSLNQLGMSQEMMQQWEKLLHTRQGMLLVTGPTGSGKSTTLYASLHTINDETKNITTVEDPIEYQVTGVNQTQVHPRIDLTFATALRHILRQDPDIILIGEIRDLETAEMAFRASLTGHLVLSTLHTNDAPSAPTRLMDMGVEPYLIASSTIGIVAQRLVRRICPRCREAVEPTAAELERLELSSEQAKKIKFHHGRGCAMCRNTGYSGRIGVYELMAITPEVRDAIAAQANGSELRRVALRNGMRSLKYDGLSKVNAGVTTAGEVITLLFAGED